MNDLLAKMEELVLPIVHTIFVYVQFNIRARTVKSVYNFGLRVISSRLKYLTITAEHINYISTLKLALEGALRIATGSSVFSSPLEIFVKNEWKAVCDYQFSATDALVACKQLGYPYVRNNYCCGSYNGQYWETEIDCTGNETKLTNCNVKSTDSSHCRSFDAVRLSCASKFAYDVYTNRD